MGYIFHLSSELCRCFENFLPHFSIFYDYEVYDCADDG